MCAATFVNTGLKCVEHIGCVLFLCVNASQKVVCLHEKFVLFEGGFQIILCFVVVEQLVILKSRFVGGNRFFVFRRIVLRLQSERKKCQ